LFPRSEHRSSFDAVFWPPIGLKLQSYRGYKMNTTWNFILAGAVTLASAAGIVSGEAAKGELSLAEAATSLSASTQTLAGSNRDATSVATAR